MSEKSQKGTWWIVGFFILVGGILYANTLNVPFYFDDFGNVQTPALQMEKGSLAEVAKVFSDARIRTRPVSNLSFAFNYYLGGYRVPGYHLVNIVIHIITAISLYFLILCTLNLPVNKKRYGEYSGIAFVAALVWLVHPIATQSVTYLVQRMNSMAAMFYMLAVLCYVTGRIRQQYPIGYSSGLWSWLLFILSFGLGLLSAGSKEIAITLPLVLFLYEFYFFQDLSWGWLKKKIVWLIAALVLVFLLSYIYLGPALLNIFSLDCPNRDFNVLERVFTQFRVVVYYIGLLLYPAPARLVLDYDFPLSLSMLSPISTLFSFLFIAFILILAVIFAKRERLFSFCVIWFFVNLLLESSIICLELVYEHRTYLPATFFYLLFVAVLYRSPLNKKILYLFFSLLCIGYSTWTFQRNVVWQNPVEMWYGIVAKFPGNARANNNYGKALGDSGDDIEAEKYFKISMDLDPRSSHPNQNMGLLYARNGKIKIAEQYYRKAISRKKDNTAALRGLGNLLLREARYAEAVELFRDVIKLKRGGEFFIAMLGEAMLREGMVEEALQYLSQAEKNDPENVDILIDLATALMELEDFDSAEMKFEKVRELNPGSIVALYNLALINVRQGKGNEALEYYRKAALLAPEKPPIFYNYANLLLRAGKHEEAENNYRRVLTEVRIVADSYNNLGIIYAGKGQYEAAENYFRTALNVDPELKEARKNLLLLQE